MKKICLFVELVLLLPLLGHAQGTEPVEFLYPPEDLGAKTLPTRAQRQQQTLGQFEVFHDFRFEDRAPESGIDFVHESVEDSLKNWMPVHYDHGNGIAVADVDSDERPDIYLTTQLGSNRLYRNLGHGRFEDITQRSGVGIADRVSVAASFADFDNDGDPDLFLTTVRGGNLLLENDGQGRFQDVTRAAGVDYSGHSSGSTLFDFDNDGLLDLFLTNIGIYTIDELGPGGFYRGIDNAFQGHIYPERTEPSILYRNLGGMRFEDVSSRVGLVDTSWSGDATFVDLNRDTWPDLYVLNMQGDDHYYQNESGEKFVERAPELFPKTPWGAMGVKFFDYNNDGRMDLIITDMHSDMHEVFIDPLQGEKVKVILPLNDAENNILGNAFYEQGEDGSFTEISDLIGTESFWPWGLSVADLNADGFEDVFIASSMNFPFRYAVNVVLLNNQGRRFLDSEFILGIEPRRDGRTHKFLFEVDCAGSDADHMVCQQLPEGTGEVRVQGALGTRASVVFDLDDDGDLDIVTNEFNDGPQVLISNLSDRTDLKFLKVRLVGSGSNRDGLGAEIQLTAGETVYSRYHDGKSGYLSQSSLPVYFGLGATDEIDHIEIVWPSGTRQTVAAPIALNSVLEINEPRSDPEPIAD